MPYLKDEDFIRGNCPMTKEDVRILTMARLNVKENSRLLDVGTGTGSIAIQGSILAPKGKVVSIERDEEAFEIALKNKEKFQCTNLEIIKGDAMDTLIHLQERFDCIFIGGSGGSLEEIIRVCDNLLLQGGKLVLNFVTLDNVYKAMNTLKELNRKVNCTQVAVSKTRGESYMLFSNNPIFIVDSEKV